MNNLGLITGILSGLFWALSGIFYVKINKFNNASHLIFILLFCIKFTPWLFFNFFPFIFEKIFRF